MGFYDFEVNTPMGEKISMADYKGKVVLVVNTATKCGLTPQFDGLEALHQKYVDQGLVILGMPCNQFASQEPQANETMVDFCRVNHGVTFQLTEKIDVNGDATHPLFAFLKKAKGGFFGSRIKWNFTKFLVDKNGKPVKRYAPTTKPEQIEEMIKQQLEA